MLNRINKLNKDDPMVRNVIEAIAKEHGVQLEEAQQVLSNLFFDTCSVKMLEFYEKECGITQIAENEDNRRSAVEAKWRSDCKCDIVMLQLLANSWKYGETNIDYKNSKLIVTFAGKGVPTDIDGLKAALEAAKPAHIPIEYVFKFNTWADLKSFTWAQLKTGTWADVKVR